MIIRTEDQGTNWTTVEPLTAATLNDITYVDDEAIWVVGDAGTVLTSSDRGLNWQLKSWPNAEYLTAVLFTSNVQGLIVSTSGKVYPTEGNGITGI